MSSKEKPNISVINDWRLHTFAHLAEDFVSPWTGILNPKGSRVTLSSTISLTKKKNLTIPLPNATALLLNAAARAFISAREIRCQNIIDQTNHREINFSSDYEAFNYIEHMIESILLAFTAIESFVNEAIPNDYKYTLLKRKELTTEVYDKKNIERHVSLDEKLTLILPEVLCCPSPKGGRAWHGYRDLKIARDRVVHMKTEDRRSSGPELDTVWKVIVTAAAPHISAKHIINYFVSSMENRPHWHINCPF